MGVINLAQATWKDVGALRGDRIVALLPAGSYEQHGPHLPIDTDTYLVSAVCSKAADRAVAGDPELEILLLPTIPIGRSSHHLDFPGSLSVSAETYIKLIEEVCDSLYPHGFRRILIVNGHGGNLDCLRIAARNVRDRMECLVGVASYWEAAGESIGHLRRSPHGGICHAGEMETACMLYLNERAVRTELIQKGIPDCVSPRLILDLVGAGSCINHNVRDFSREGVLGDPTVADAAHGKALMDAIVSDVADLILDFSRWDFTSLVAGQDTA
jgi:creatinine amidohydrolase